MKRKKMDLNGLAVLLKDDTIPSLNSDSDLATDDTMWVITKYPTERVREQEGLGIPLKKEVDPDWSDVLYFQKLEIQQAIQKEVYLFGEYKKIWDGVSEGKEVIGCFASKIEAETALSHLEKWDYVRVRHEAHVDRTNYTGFSQPSTGEGLFG